MACIQYPRKERGGVSMGGPVQPTIYKEPLKEIFTKKKERVEEGDITHLIRNEPSRINDAITNWQKGKNMMVEVDYQNRAPQTTTMHFGSASNPYKINKSFRPPEYGLLDLQPLSRQKRPYVAGQTNIGSGITRDDHSEIRMDQSQINFSIGADRDHYEATAMPAKEMGIYYDNFTYKDMVNDEYVTKHVLSQLKGMESVELQKFFQYENTPNGIVLTPLSFSVISSVMGPQDTSSHHLSDVGSHVKEIVHIGQGTNQAGPMTYSKPDIQTTVFIHEDGGLRYGVTSNQNGRGGETTPIDSSSFVTERISYGQGTNQMGQPFIDGQRHVSGVESHLGQELRVGQGTNQMGQPFIDGQRHVSGVESHLVQAISVGQGTNQMGQPFIDGQRHVSGIESHLGQAMSVGQGTNQMGQPFIEGQRHLSGIDAHIGNELQTGKGTNQAGVHMVTHNEHHDKMKDILLKNMTSSVSIVIQQPSGHEQSIQGTIHDKINIVVHSAKGQPIVLARENGEPIRLKEYTWKFVKSASGADKFIIQVDHAELELERKAELYSVSSNPGQAVIQPEAEEINLRRDVRHTSAVTNVGIAGDIDRVDESFMRRVEKTTHYTDHRTDANTFSMDRPLPNMAIKSHESSKKQHLSNIMLKQSEGRF